MKAPTQLYLHCFDDSYSLRLCHDFDVISWNTLCSLFG
eukprot:COSAG01_NODE_243_length_20572_cov_24.956137_3_plen_38_part_00